MNNTGLQRIISYIPNVLFGIGNRLVRFIPVYAIQEGRFYDVTAIILHFQFSIRRGGQWHATASIDAPDERREREKKMSFRIITLTQNL